MIHSTEVAQRRLLEALADLQNTPGLDIGQQADPLSSLLVGIQSGIEVAESMGELGIARLYAALSDLAVAVRDDHNREEIDHG